MKLSFFFLFLASLVQAQEITQPTQPTTGPGGSEYFHEEINYQDFAESADGYWLFEPAAPKPDSAHLIIFIHGYGGYNPMIYADWIDHLVKKGNIVVFPRYQKHQLYPTPNLFAEYVALAIQNALEELNSGDHVRPILAQFAFVGHSYGGTITADLAINFEKFEIPKPQVLFLCSPGTGPLSMGRLESYKDMPADVQMLIMTSEDDHVVGDEFGLKVFNESTQVCNRNFIRQFRDKHGEPRISAYHNESYCLDEKYDSGHRPSTVSRAFRWSKLNAVDYFGYWKLFDAMLECSRNDRLCNYAFGNTPEQRSLGNWSDGQAIKELEVMVPEDQ